MEDDHDDANDNDPSSRTYPAITHSATARLQTFVRLADLQNLVLYVLADGVAPQWCAVRQPRRIRRVVVLMVPGLEAGMFDGSIALDGQGAGSAKGGDVEDDDDEEGKVEEQRVISPDDFYPVRLQADQLPAPLRPFADMFAHLWPVMAPGDDRYGKLHSPLAGMLSVPVVKAKEESSGPNGKKNGLNTGAQKSSEGRGGQDRRVPITALLATTAELIDEGYVLHPAHGEENVGRAAKKEPADGWVDTPGIAAFADGEVEIPSAATAGTKVDPLTAGHKILALDCEMCLISPPGAPQVFRLTRATAVNWAGEVVLDELVCPAEPITDYLTPYSGITADLLANVTTTLADVQRKLLALLTPTTILIGHSLNGDLAALRLTHPYVADTALLYPHPRGPPLKSSLKFLAQKHLSREIQKGHGATGHDSVEDARAALDLVKVKCNKGRAFGTPDANHESIFTRLAKGRRGGKKAAAVEEEGGTKGSKKLEGCGAVVDWGDPTRGYGAAAGTAIGCSSDAEVVAGVLRAIGGADTTMTADDEEPTTTSLPQEGCEFVWARLRELEAHRGWWNRTTAADTEVLRTNAIAATTTNTESTANPGNDFITTETAAAPPTTADILARTTAHIAAIHAALPPRSALIVYSGSGDPRALARMQRRQQTFRQEYRTKKWDQLSVRWTDAEEQKLRRACERARRGVGFVGVK